MVQFSLGGCAAPNRNYNSAEKVEAFNPPSKSRVKEPTFYRGTTESILDVVLSCIGLIFLLAAFCLDVLS